MRTDQELRADILAELERDPRVRSTEIGVIVKHGAVTLTGVVEDFADKVAAERAVKRLKGVRAIAEDIQVKRPAELRLTDEGIAERIAEILSWSSTFRDTDIQAEVRDGHVTLSGEVDGFYQKQAAARRVGELEGVTGIFNRIRVRETAAGKRARDIEREIMSALHRHANIEASKVRVTVSGSNVTLDGTVDALHERDLIEDAVRHTVGVTDVIDNLAVGASNRRAASAPDVG
jgi:osmotically-inducible protein OsmY